MTSYRRSSWGSGAKPKEPTLDQVLFTIRRLYVELEQQKGGPKKVTVQELEGILERARTMAT